MVSLTTAWLAMGIEVSSKKSNWWSNAGADVSPTSSALYTIWCLSDPKWYRSDCHNELLMYI